MKKSRILASMLCAVLMVGVLTVPLSLIHI